jgi:hypothetical protein
LSRRREFGLRQPGIASAEIAGTRYANSPRRLLLRRTKAADGIADRLKKPAGDIADASRYRGRHDICCPAYAKTFRGSLDAIL